MFKFVLYPAVALLSIFTCAGQVAELPAVNDSITINATVQQKAVKLGEVTISDKKLTLVKNIALPVAIAGAWVSTYKFVDARLQDEVMERQSSSTYFVASKFEPFGRSKNLYPIFGGFLAYGVLANDNRATKTAIIGTTALLANGAIVSNLKGFFNRHRPTTGDPYNSWDGPGNDNGVNHSFPSSHTATAFTAATVIATSYADTKWVPVVCYSAATMVGLSRIYQNHHWASDVMAGALVGYLTAKSTYIAYNYFERKYQHRKHLQVVPMAGIKMAGLSATLTF